MFRIAVVTDSNSGITPLEASKLGVYVIPMPFTIDGENYFEDINLSQEDFYKKLQEDAKIFTSQPAVGDIMTLWDDLLNEYDFIIHIPMSSGLSKACETARMLSEYEKYDGKVYVVNNQRISVTQRQSVLDALELINKGKTALEIKDILEATKFDSSIYITLDTLKYLCRGGRVTKSAATFAKFLGIKPVLTIQGDKLDAHAKVRGHKKAIATMISALRKDIEERFDGKYEDMHMYVAYTCYENIGNDVMEIVKKEFPNGIDYTVRPLSLSISCHIGPGAFGVGFAKKI